MDWINQIGGMLGNYQNQNQTQGNQQNVEQDFNQVYQAAPNPTVAEGLSAAFRSNQTPAFGNMFGQMFGQAGGQQRAGMLNMLLAAAGPMVLQQVMSRMGNRGGATAGGGQGYSQQSGGGLAGIMDMIRGGGQAQITPEMAEQLSPQEVEAIAEEAEKHDPSIVDRVSSYASENPEVVKGLGAVAMTVALAHLANRYMGSR